MPLGALAYSPLDPIDLVCNTCAAGPAQPGASLTLQELTMNWERIEGNWKTLSGKLRSEWGRLTDKDREIIEGHREQLARWQRKVEGDERRSQAPKESP